jgi:hypothetical protein
MHWGQFGQDSGDEKLLPAIRSNGIQKTGSSRVERPAHGAGLAGKVLSLYIMLLALGLRGGAYGALAGLNQYPYGSRKA